MSPLAASVFFMLARREGPTLELWLDRLLPSIVTGGYTAVQGEKHQPSKHRGRRQRGVTANSPVAGYRSSESKRHDPHDPRGHAEVEEENGMAGHDAVASPRFRVCFFLLAQGLPLCSLQKHFVA